MTQAETTTHAPDTGAHAVPALFDDQRAGAIYKAAAAMIRRRGFAQTSMADIADAVALTKPGLYYYVKGKQELLFSIMRYAMDLLDAEVMAKAEPVADPEARLRTIVGAHARLLMRDEHGALGILIDEVEGLSGAQKEAIIGRKRRYFDFVRDTIEALRQQRGLTGIEPTAAAFSVLGMIMWLSRWYSPDGPVAAEEIAEDLTEIALAGVLADRPSLRPVPTQPI